MDNDTSKRSAWALETQLVRAGTERTGFHETSEAMFLNSGYVYGSAEEAEAAFNDEIDRFVYSRFGNPTIRMFEDRLKAIEGAPACRATSSGMAAVFASLACFLNAGDRLVASRALFGSCHHICTQIMPRFGVECVLVDGRNMEEWEQALSTPAQAVFLESPSNPGLEVIDIPSVAKLAKAAGARVVVDNVFATPILQKPLELGADVVVYSATKHIDGQGRTLGGAILGDEDYINELLVPFTRHTGPSLSPFNAWVLLKGLETLELRVQRQCENAVALAQALDGHPKLNRLLYPGLGSHPQHNLAMSQMSAGGTLVAFEVDGGKEAAFRMLNALEIIDISNNLGDSKSLICHPATTTHQKLPQEDKNELGLTSGFVRLSVGLESSKDLIGDVTGALDVA